MGRQPASKAGTVVDRHVGSRVRLRRLVAGVTQEQLAEAIGVTFQQVQKYEKGLNRISSSRLQQLGQALGVEVAYFFAEGPVLPQAGALVGDDRSVSDLLSRPDAVRLLRAFARVGNGAVRARLVDLVEQLDGRPGSSKV